MLERFRPRSARSADALILSALTLALTALYSHYALRVATFQNDEELYIRLARYLSGHLPGGLWQAGIYTRGLQRLDPLVLAPAFALLRGPGAFEVDHVIQCLLFASTALPVFLLARRAGLGRSASHLSALLSVIVPWAVVSTSFLTESLAYPVFAWALYTAWLAAWEPTLRHEALALAVLAAAVFSRTALLALAPLLPLAAIWHTWRFELAAGSRGTRLRMLPTRLWSRHRLLGLMAVAAFFAYALDAAGLMPASISKSLTGSYGLPHLEPLSSLYARDRYYISRAAAGTGFVPLGFGVAWVLVTLVRSRDVARHGLAVVCALALLCVLLSLLQAAPDERYVVYLSIPVALAFAAALRDRVGLTVIAGGVITVLLIDSVTWPPLANLYDYFSYPAATFYARVLINHLGRFGIGADRVLEGGILLASILWAIAARRGRSSSLAAAVLGLAVLALGATQLIYTMQKYTAGAGAGSPAAARSWIDRHVPGGARVSALAVSFGASFSYQAIWREAEFWNTSIEQTAYSGNPGYAPFPLGMEGVGFEVRPGSGLLRAVTEGGHPVPPPQLMLVPRVTTLSLGLDAERVWQDPVLLLDLERLREPVRADWKVSGISPEGFIRPRRPALLRVYNDAFAKGDGCATMALVAPPNFTGRWHYSVTSAVRGTLRAGTLAAQQAVTLTFPLPREATSEGTMAKLRLRVGGSILYPNGEHVSARVENVSVLPCPTAQP